MLKRITFLARWSTTDIKWRWWSNRGKNQHPPKNPGPKISHDKSWDCFGYSKKSLLKSSHPIQYQISLLKRIPELQISKPKIFFGHPRHLKSGVQPPSLPPRVASHAGVFRGAPLKTPAWEATPGHFPSFLYLLVVSVFHDAVKPSLMQDDWVHSAGVNVACEHFAFIRLIIAIGDFTMRVVKSSS